MAEADYEGAAPVHQSKASKSSKAHALEDLGRDSMQEGAAEIRLDWIRLD